MAFSFGSSKPILSLGLGGTTNNNNTTTGSTSIFGGSTLNTNSNTTQNPNQQTTNTNPFAQTTTGAQQQGAMASGLNASTATNTNAASTSNPQIDITHLRSTTKYDHLTSQLQQEILALDTAILNQIKQCTEVSNLIPSVTSAGTQISPAIDFVSSKLDELEVGLENDADAVVGLRDGSVGRDQGEAKCVFRTVDRLKVPRQYQVGVGDVSQTMGMGFNGGLSGWWNQPQTLRGTSMRTAGAGSSVQLVDEDADDDGGSGSGWTKGPNNLLDLFGERAREMNEKSAQQRKLLAEIEDFVGGLEGKVLNKERELNERLDNGVGGGRDDDTGFLQRQDERDHQMQLLRFVFGEVQRNLYDVAEKIGNTRDGVVDLTYRR